MVKCSAGTDLVLTSVPCCQALYRLSPYYQFGNGYMERVSWWLKTHSGVGNWAFQLQTYAMIHSSTDSERGQYARWAVLGGLGWSRAHGSSTLVLFSRQPWPLSSRPLKGLGSLLLCLLSHNSRCLSWDSVWFCTVFHCVLIWSRALSTLLGWWWAFRTVPISLNHNISLTSTVLGMRAVYSTLM